MLDLREAFDMVMQKPHSQIWTRVVSQALASCGLHQLELPWQAANTLLSRLGLGLQWHKYTCAMPGIEYVVHVTPVNIPAMDLPFPILENTTLDVQQPRKIRL